MHDISEQLVIVLTNIFMIMIIKCTSSNRSRNGNRNHSNSPALVLHRDARRVVNAQLFQLRVNAAPSREDFDRIPRALAHDRPDEVDVVHRQVVERTAALLKEPDIQKDELKTSF